MRFARDAAGAVSALFFPVEIELLRLAVTQLLELLDAAGSHALGASEDPAVRRLLPDAYRDDAEAAAEFRRFTAEGLIDRKEVNARTVLAALGDAPAGGSLDDAGSDDDVPVAILLDDAAVQAWLRTLTDLRLTLAERLEISPDGVQHLDAEEAPFLAGVYDWLGMVQESLVYAIDV